MLIILSTNNFSNQKAGKPIHGPQNKSKNNNQDTDNYGCSNKFILGWPSNFSNFCSNFVYESHNFAHKPPFSTSPYWQARRDSNPQPADLESAALPIRATGLTLSTSFPYVRNAFGISHNTYSTPASQMLFFLKHACCNFSFCNLYTLSE